MRLLHVVPSYLPAVRYGGPILSVHGLCKALVGRGHDVEVFTTNVDGPGESDVPVGVPVDVDGVKVRYFSVPALRRLYWSPSMGKALRQRLGSFDVVHTHSVFLWPTWAAARTARQMGIPYVLSPRGMLVEDLIKRRSSLLKRGWISLIERGNIAGASLVHFTGQIEARDVAALSMPVRGSCVIPNGVDFSDVARANQAEKETPFLLFIGRINWKKGLDLLILALRDIPDFRLVIVGNDEEGLKVKLEALAANAGVLDRVSFEGPIYGGRKDALLSRATLLVLASYSENFGNVVVEAMAAGCPVIVTPEVGAADIVRESGAGAVLNGNSAALSKGIRSLIADPDALRLMGQRGRDFARQRLGWNTIASQIEEAYLSVIARQERDSGNRVANK